MDSRTLIKYCVYCYLFVSVNSTASLGQQKTELSGVFLGDRGGISATARGTIWLLVGHTIHKLPYQRPYAQNLATPECRKAGALWTVRIETEDPARFGQVIGVACKDGYDHSVRSAVETVQRYLSFLAKGQYRSAYNLLAGSSRKKCPYRLFLSENKDLDLKDYLGFGSDCLVVLSKHAQKTTISGDISCSISKGGEPYSMEFELVRATHGKWAISGVFSNPPEPNNRRVYKKLPDGSEQYFFYGVNGDLLKTYSTTFQELKSYLYFAGRRVQVFGELGSGSWGHISLFTDWKAGR